MCFEVAALKEFFFATHHGHPAECSLASDLWMRREKKLVVQFTS